MPRPRKPANPFRYFHSSPEVIRMTAMLYVRFLLSLRNVEDLLFERGIDICHETVLFWWNRFGPMFAANNRAAGLGIKTATSITLPPPGKQPRQPGAGAVFAGPSDHADAL